MISSEFTNVMEKNLAHYASLLQFVCACVQCLWICAAWRYKYYPGWYPDMPWWICSV